jgi:hypothetical protein
MCESVATASEIQSSSVSRPPTGDCTRANSRKKPDDLLEHLVAAARRSPHLRSISSPRFARAGQEFSVPHFMFNGPPSGGEVMRLGLFAGIHGDEPEGVQTLVALLERLEAEPKLAAGYQLLVYPVCNPTGYAAGTRHSATGRDLNREFWKRSEEPEVHWLEHELATKRFDGLISLHSDDTANGYYAYVRGGVFTETLARPALNAATQLLPVDTRNVIDGFRNRAGLLYECFTGVLAAPPVDLDPQPFEIILETPQPAPVARQVQANLAAILVILEAYPGFLGYQTGI